MYLRPIASVQAVRIEISLTWPVAAVGLHQNLHVGVVKSWCQGDGWGRYYGGRGGYRRGQGYGRRGRGSRRRFANRCC